MPIFVHIDGGKPLVTPQTIANLGSGASVSLPTVPFGSPRGDRWMLFAISWDGGFAAAINSITIDGIAVTQIAQITGGSASRPAAYIGAAKVISGTSGTLAIGFSATQAGCGVTAFSMTGWNGIHSDFVINGPNPLSINTHGNTAVIGCGTAQNNFVGDPAINTTWSGLTKYGSVYRNGQVFREHNSAYENLDAAETPRVISLGGNWTQAAAAATAAFWN